MPVQLTRDRTTGAIHWHKTCEKCGADNASWGYGVSAYEGLALILAGERERGYRKLGRWYCYEHRPEPPVPGAPPSPEQAALF